MPISSCRNAGFDIKNGYNGSGTNTLDNAKFQELLQLSRDEVDVEILYWISDQGRALR